MPSLAQPGPLHFARPLLAYSPVSQLRKEGVTNAIGHDRIQLDELRESVGKVVVMNRLGGRSLVGNFVRPANQTENGRIQR